MLLQETILIKAPAQKVWDTMMDIPFLVSCMPGVEQVKEVDADNFTATLKAKVSFISVAFDMALRITDRKVHEHVEARGEGKGLKGAGRIAFSQTVTLRPISQDETEATYRLEVNIIGRLAAVGGKAIARKTDDVAGAFREAFVARCEGRIVPSSVLGD